MTLYCCQRCNFGGIPVCIHSKMRSHASRRNEPTDVQQTSLSGKIILLFPFQIHEVEIFSSVDEEVVANGGEATEIVGIIANNGEATEIVDVVPDDGEATKLICVRLSVLLLTTVKQRRLFMLLLTTMKQQKLFMLLHVVVDDGKATGIGYVVPDNVFFFLNICAKFWDCLAACFKSFYS